ncbi:hypothetical protein, partial [Moorena sp. SIO4A5]|uniref:hypothetical protein n=1 Tax=Moorena sp. SIO4A5 TaxID=2607838 RepID=UPI0025DCA7C8
LQVNRVNNLQVGRLQINQVTSCRLVSCRLCSQLSFTIFVVEYNLKPTLANRPRYANNQITSPTSDAKGEQPNHLKP